MVIRSLAYIAYFLALSSLNTYKNEDVAKKQKRGRLIVGDEEVMEACQW